MVNAARVLGVVGNLISFFLFLSPLPTIVTVYNNRSVQQFSSTPYLATCVNCVVGVLYALPLVTPDNTPLLVVNALGAAIELVYIAIFFVFAIQRRQRIFIIRVVVTHIIFMVILSSITFTVLHTPAKRTVVGYISVFFSICMYASPLYVVRTVIQNRSVEFMPFSIFLASFLNCVAWTTYAGLHHFDLFILIPNGIGVVLSFLQLILYGIYYKSTQRQLAARNAQEGRGEIVMGNDDNARTIRAYV